MAPPTEANTLRIGPYKKDWTLQQAKILTLPSDQIKNLKDEPSIEIHVSVNNLYSNTRTISSGKLSFAALDATMPGITVHLQHNKQILAEDIKHVVLPPSTIEAYESILNWIELVVDAGQIEPFPVATTMPIWHYKCLLEAAQAVKMDYLVEDLNERITKLLTVTPGQEFSLDILDVLRVVEMSVCEDKVRLQLLTALRRAGKEGAFSEVFKMEYKEYLLRYRNCELPPLEGE